jgi:hypothetical protein
MKIKKIIYLIILTSILYGCKTIDNRNLEETQLQIREYQTRSYEDKSIDKVLKTALNVLQDEGFIIKNADANLGYITGSREFNLGSNNSSSYNAIKKNPLFIVLKTYLDLYLLPFTIWGKMQDKREVSAEYIEATINVTSFGDKTRVRVNFQHKSSEQIGQIKDPNYYQAFFAKMDKGLFISRENL